MEGSLASQAQRPSFLQQQLSVRLIYKAFLPCSSLKQFPAFNALGGYWRAASSEGLQLDQGHPVSREVNLYRKSLAYR